MRVTEPEPTAGEDDRERELRRAAEALLLVTEEPITVELLAQLLEVSAERIEALCVELAAEYDATDRGFQLVKVAGGWRYQTHPDLAPYVERYVLDGQSGRLSNAALETLAIVAYKQPMSRAQIAAIRGVNVDGVMRTLVQRGYVDEVGRDHGPGQAVLYGTTPTFLEKLGLNSLDELPALGEFVPGADVYEALEHGLRPDPLDADTTAPVDDDGDGEPAPDAADDESE
ncbi:MAG TPA: SMC-Scp complex subunit ScpB [Acidimicrobiaceae bacterium]|nr:SMC-Scp complex subunit ScpB [Acidimicrobiaceae bacterium]